VVYLAGSGADRPPRRAPTRLPWARPRDPACHDRSRAVGHL